MKFNLKLLLLCWFMLLSRIQNKEVVEVRFHVVDFLISIFSSLEFDMVG